MRVCRYNNTVRFFDLFLCKNVFRSARASRLDLHETIFFLRRFLNTFRRHISMGNSCRTGRYGKNFKSVCRSFVHICKTLVNIALLRICLIDNIKKFIGAFCISQRIGKYFIHHQYRQLAQHVQMYVIFRIRRCDQKHQRNRLSVQCVEFYSVFYYHCRKTRFRYRITFSMRNGNSFSDSCGAFFFSCVYLFSVCFTVVDLSACNHKINNPVKRFTFRFRSLV